LRYFDDLTRVEEPEDYLQVNKYMELTHKTKPVIQISLQEIKQNLIFQSSQFFSGELLASK